MYLTNLRLTGHLSGFVCLLVFVRLGLELLFCVFIFLFFIAFILEVCCKGNIFLLYGLEVMFLSVFKLYKSKGKSSGRANSVKPN